jgi:hypothetical protein
VGLVDNFTSYDGLSFRDAHLHTLERRCKALADLRANHDPVSLVLAGPMCTWGVHVMILDLRFCEYPRASPSTDLTRVIYMTRTENAVT